MKHNRNGLPITDKHADILIATLIDSLLNTRRVVVDSGRQVIAAIVMDAVTADVTLHPLHAAYARRFKTPSL